jgi:hypothetical protein
MKVTQSYQDRIALLAAISSDEASRVAMENLTVGKNLDELRALIVADLARATRPEKVSQ